MTALTDVLAQALWAWKNLAARCRTMLKRGHSGLQERSPLDR
jgi:uncharacterized protein (DUF2384 family)